MDVRATSAQTTKLIEWAEDDFQFHAGGAAFWTPLEPGATREGGDGMEVFKSRALIERYLAIFEADRPKMLMELGIHHGGSTALLGMIDCLERIVSIELNQDRLPDLDAFIEAHGLQDKISANFGVDQADPKRLNEVMDDGFGDSAIDIVIDDASHALAPTRVSFDTIFPRVAPGGLYIIEDWTGMHLMARRLAKKLQGKGNRARREPAMARAIRLAKGAPLSIMATELALAMVEAPDVIDSVTIDPHWIGVRKSVDAPAAAKDPSFRLANLYNDDFGLVAVPAAK